MRHSATTLSQLVSLCRQTAVLAASPDTQAPPFSGGGPRFCRPCHLFEEGHRLPPRVMGEKQMCAARRTPTVTAPKMRQSACIRGREEERGLHRSGRQHNATPTLLRQRCTPAYRPRHTHTHTQRHRPPRAHDHPHQRCAAPRVAAARTRVCERRWK